MNEEKGKEIPREEISDLITAGDELLELLEEKIAISDHDYQKKRNIFTAEYTKWYTRCLPVVRSMVPDKAVRFESLYHNNKRSGTNEYTYTILDYLQGVYFKDKPKSYTDSITAKRLKDQTYILQAALPRISNFSFEMERFVKINPILGQPSDQISKQEKFIDIDFSDEHYDTIVKEINSSFKRGSFMATFLLSKELIRDLLLDIIRIRFPLASDEQISLYYDMQNSTHREIRALLGVIREKKDEFEINPQAIDQLIGMIGAIEPELRPDSHSFQIIPKRDDMENYRIEETIELLNDMIEFMKK